MVLVHVWAVGGGVVGCGMFVRCGAMSFSVVAVYLGVDPLLREKGSIMSVTTSTTSRAAAAVSASRTAPRTGRRAARLWRVGVVAGVAAAAATTLVAAVAKGAGVPLEIDGAPIPPAAFAQLTLMCVAMGVVLAKALGRWAARPKATFVAVTVALTALSFVPDVVAAASVATKIVLMAAHVTAAVIVVPLLARRLPETR